MDIVVTSRNAEVHTNFRDAVESKLVKVSQFYPRAQRVDVLLTHESNPRLADRSEKVELTVHGDGPVIRAEAESSDRYAAVDLASSKLFERLRRLRDRAKSRRRVRVVSNDRYPLDLSEFDASSLEESLKVTLEDDAETTSRSVQDLKVGETLEEQMGDSPVLVRQKVYDTKPMNVGEAIDQMELVGHPFFLFVDKDTMQPCVVYNRKGWTYGVLRLNVRVDMPNGEK